MKHTKKSLVFATILMMSIMPIVLAGPITQTPLIGTNPIYTESNFVPLVFLDTTGGRALFDDPYGVNGNVSTRTNNYAFTGEQIEWKVLVWDKNGVPEKINDVFAGWVNQTNGPHDPDMQANCQYIGPATGNLANQGFPNVRRPGDQEAQITANPDTMGLYTCRLTIEPTCHGQKWMGVKAIDLSGLNGTMQEAESWFCNPELDLQISGNINFGELGSGEQGASTISVKNAAEDGSGVQVVLAISGKDFYDPSHSGALCPTSNVLVQQGDGTAFHTGFWYSAIQGSLQTNNSLSGSNNKFKRIPYGITNLAQADPVFSINTGMNANWSSPLNSMSPGSETSMTLHLGIPQPCNGQFTDGQIYLWSYAI